MPVRSFAALLAALLISGSALGDDQKRSPFDALRWVGDTVEVRVGESGWVRLEEIDDLAIETILDHCAEEYGDDARKRFREDLVIVLTALDSAPGDTVRLKVRTLDTNEVRVFEDVPMTYEKRQRLWRQAEAEERVVEAAPPARRVIPRAAALADLEQLDQRCDAQWSYLYRRDVDIRAALAALGRDLPAQVRVADLGIEIHRVLALAGDGHARVQDFVDLVPAGYLPFLVDQAGPRFVAFRSDRTAFAAPDHPFLVALDGQPVERWLAAAEPFVPAGSAALVRHRSVRMLRFVAFLRDRMGIAASDEIGATFANADGAEVTRTFALADERPIYGHWPRRPVERIENFGYIRIPQMNRAMPTMVKSAIEGFDTTDGLIIDVRGNSGGSRETLRMLWPMLVPADAPPTIINLAQYRMSPRFGEAHLARRGLFLPEFRGWSPEHIEVMDAFLPTFRPEWQPPVLEFSAWHFMLLGGRGSIPGISYEKPVVVLIDGGCFSATDIFAGALEMLPHVTLLGLPTGGGSGYARTGRLANSGLEIYLSSMISFRPNGKLYDGNGIAPDIVVEPSPGFFIAKDDPQLDAALDLLRKGGGQSDE